MRHLRVCIYGGLEWDKVPAAFVAALANKIVGSIPAVIVTGGVHHPKEKPKAVSTDAAALEGARRYTKQNKKDLRDYYEAWIPDPLLDGRPDIGGAVRMTKEDGSTVRVIAGRTALGRRLAMVAGVAMVVTIAGRQHTEVVVEHALELGIPVPPIPDAGGDSRDLLNKYWQRIADGFDPGALETCLGEVSKAIEKAPETAAAAVVNLIRTANTPGPRLRGCA